MKDKVKRLQEYVWARHIDRSANYDHSVDEEEAIGFLDEYYAQIANRNSPDQVYLAVLLFERAFDHPDEQDELFARAKKIFDFYRRVTGEYDWDVIEDRLADIAMHFGEEPEPAPVETAPEPPVVAEPAPEPVPESAVGSLVEAAPAVAVAAEPAAEEAEIEEVIDDGVEQEQVARREAAEAFIADLEVVEGMMLVPAGTFQFGPENREHYLDTYYIDRTGVTNEEYGRFMGETGYRAPRGWDDTKHKDPQQPVVGVSFADAMQYAKWAGKELPTEMQWEKAARGTEGLPFPWGNDPPGASDACFGLDPIEGAPVAVGRTLRNVSPFGAHDLCGNVWEWTRSRYEKGSEYLVIRGGCYNDPIELLHLDFRMEAHPKDKHKILGFRCVRNVH